MAKKLSTTIIFDLRKAQKICTSCGKVSVAESGMRRCRPCQDSINKSHNERRRILTSQGICFTCQTPCAPGLKRCRRCLDKSHAHTYAREVHLTSIGMCSKCAQNPCLPAMIDRTSKSSLCQTCYLKRTARNSLGSYRLWKPLFDLLVAQDWRCAYTGDLIILADNDAIDHEQPVSRFPDRRGDVTNVEWVTRDINQMKWNRTREEFLTLLRSIYGKTPGLFH